MKKLLLLPALLLLVVSSSRPAHADTFTFTFTSGDYSASGMLVAQLQSSNPNTYLIGSASGSVTTTSGGLQTISSLLPPDPSPQHFEDNDNKLFYPASPGFFDINGVSFLLADGTEFNIFFDPNSGYGAFYMNAAGTATEEDGTASVVALPASSATTPEPSSLVLLGTGVLGCAGAIRRRFVS